ncbi:hypothetical protein BKH46_05930 [Helicobacter sp. 12S02634-8]|nr:hypothetical protein BKH46_05930 [Helicobacter sp. 12S02634-8]
MGFGFNRIYILATKIIFMQGKYTGFLHIVSIWDFLPALLSSIRFNQYFLGTSKLLLIFHFDLKMKR